MTSAFRTVVGISILAGLTAMGCDGGTGDGPDPATGGTGAGVGGTGAGTGGASSGVGGTGTGTGGSTPAVGVPLIPANGWVDGASNKLLIQGAMFSFADDTTKTGLTDDFTGANACISGTAAMVPATCAPATDCFSVVWGAAIGFNLNQPMVEGPGGVMVGGDAIAFDATGLKGFGFSITGDAIPTTLRFKVENAAGEFCTPLAKPIVAGANTVLYSDLLTECWIAGGTSPDGAGLIKIAWQVVTNNASEVPFDFCVSDVVAIEK